VIVNAKNPPRSEFIVSLFLVVIILAAYWQLPTNDFLYFDDNWYITQNTHVQEGITRESVAWAFSFTDNVYWHPLTWLSHMLDFQLFGLRPGMHHLANLFLHIANSLLLFLTLKRMTGSHWRSAFIAALFALHPLNVESVAWASERKNVLSTFFWMLTLLTYSYYAERPGFNKYLLAIFVFALGLMAKPMLVTLPFVLLLLDYWPLGRFKLAQSGSGRNLKALKSINDGIQWPLVFRLVLEKIPFLALSFVSIYLSSLSLKRLGFIISINSVPMKLRITNALVSYVSYIKMMIWPHNLVVFYPFPEFIPLWQAAGAGLLLVSISVLVFRALRSKPYLAVGWLWYLGTLVPVIGLVQAGLWPGLADRFAYVPLIGLFILTTWMIPDKIAELRYGKKGLAVAAATALSAFMICTWFQVRHWQNGITLFTHNIHVTPNNRMAHLALGNAYDIRGELNEALFHYVKSLQIKPDFAEAHNNLGYVLARQGNDKDAIGHYTEALRINPTYAKAHNNLGSAMARQGKVQGSILHYRKALHFNPNKTKTLYNLSWISATYKDKKFRNGQEAITLAEKLCKITQYNHPLALDALAAAYAETGKFDAAVLTAQKGLKLALLYGPEELALGLKNRLQLYQAGHPYRQQAYKRIGFNNL
jgi:tetratricopeptide (TPR) repeat protein